MAVRKGTDGVGQWTSKMYFPKGKYTLHCIDEELKRSQSGNPMLVRSFEIVAPDVIDLGDKKVNIAGNKVTQFRVTKTSDPNTSDKCWSSYRDELEVVGVPQSEEIDDENPPCHFKGKTVEAVLSGDKRTVTADPTPEERAQGKRVGAPIMVDGKEVISYQIQIDQILGLSTTQISSPY